MLFSAGQIVRHKLSQQEMIVIEYEMDPGPFSFGSRPQGPPTPTGRILCSWVDKNNHPHQTFYYEVELVAV